MTRMLLFQGKNLSVNEWADNLGISSNTIHTRLSAGWPLDEVLSRVEFTKGTKKRKGHSIRKPIQEIVDNE